jgi:hypothetical protein
VRTEIPLEGSIRSGIDSTKKVKQDPDPGYEVDRTRQARVVRARGRPERRGVEQLISSVDTRALGREGKAALVMAI